MYESGAFTRRTLGWRAPTTYPNQNLELLIPLRDRSRKAVRDDGYAGSIIRSLVTNIVGTGIRPLSKADDREFAVKAQALWDRWTVEADSEGMNDWYGLQAQVVQTWLEAGECFVRLRPRLPVDGLTVPLQIQVLEPEMCPHMRSWLTPNGNQVRAGIEFDVLGRRAAYYFYSSRPGDPTDFLSGDLRRVDAADVLHVYKQARPGQIRGVPILQAALVRLWDLDKFADATLMRQMLSNMFVAFLKNMGGGSTVNALTGDAQETEGINLPIASDRPVLGLEPGTFQELAPGEEVDFSKPPDVFQGYVDFVRHHLRAAGGAAGVPYEVFTSDLSQVNDRTVRVILHEFRRSIEADQHQRVAYQLCGPVWRAWMDAAFLSKALPIPAAYATDSEPWTRAKWIPQGWKYIHPVQDVQAAKEAIRNGLTSRSNAVAESGEDAEVIDAEQAADNKRADDLEVMYDSDGRRPARGPTVKEAEVAPTNPEPTTQPAPRAPAKK